MRTAVVQHVKRLASARKLEVRLRTLKVNLGAKRLYERKGFVVSNHTNQHWNMVTK